MMQACCAGADAADTPAGDGADGCWLEQAANPSPAITLAHFQCMRTASPTPWQDHGTIQAQCKPHEEMKPG
jgi:hypothetical protein